MCFVSRWLGKAFPPSHLANCKTSADTARRLRPVPTMHFRDDLLPISESTAANLASSLLRRDSGRRRYIHSSRMSTREARCTCPSAHVTDCLGELVFEAQRPPSARCRNAYIFASPGADTKFAPAGPQLPLLTDWPSGNGRSNIDNIAKNVSSTNVPHFLNGQRSLHGHAKTRLEVAAPESSGLCACSAVHGHGRCVISLANAARPSWAAQARNIHTAAASACLAARQARKRLLT